jgi:hypothetical protein
MATLPRNRNRVKAYPPAEVEAWWTERPETVAARLLSGATCGLVLGRADALVLYRLTADLDGECVVSWRLANTDNGKSYDLPADCSACDCGDTSYRSREGGCKHRVGLRFALKRINLL